MSGSPAAAAAAAAAAIGCLGALAQPCYRPLPACSTRFLDTDSVALPENFCIIESPESVKVRCPWQGAGARCRQPVAAAAAPPWLCKLASSATHELQHCP